MIYRPTEAKYKGGAEECYVTYDLDQRTRGGGHVLYPKVKRVYIAGKVTGWKAGRKLRKRTGRTVNGVAVEYRQSRKAYKRGAFAAKRGRTQYTVKPSRVSASKQDFVQIVEVPPRARNVQFHSAVARVPARYRGALQRVR
jgi:ribosomal protein S17